MSENTTPTKNRFFGLFRCFEWSLEKIRAFFAENCGSYGVLTFFRFSAERPPPSGAPFCKKNQLFKIPYDNKFSIFFDDSNAKSSTMSIYYRKKIAHPVKKKFRMCFFDFSIFRIFGVFCK